MTVVADVNADLGVGRLKYRITGVARLEVKLFPEARVDVRYVMFAIDADNRSVGVDYGGGVVVYSGHRGLVNRKDYDHSVFLGQFAHKVSRGSGYRFRGSIPLGVLLGAEIRPVENFLKRENFNAFLSRVLYHLHVFGNHCLFDFLDRMLVRLKDVGGLYQTAFDDS